MNESLNSECVNGVVYKYGAEWTKKLESKQHWEFYWYQQKLMEGLVGRQDNEKLLEIGVGSGFTANYCRSKGLDVTTLDIDAEKKPDIVANAVNYVFDKKYQHLLAFEVFEHIPYSEFEKFIYRIPDFISLYVFLSLPSNKKPVFSLNLKLPKLKPFLVEWRISAGKISTEAHHWELDYKEYSTGRVEALFSSAGLRIVKVMAFRYIQFYALAVNKR